MNSRSLSVIVLSGGLLLLLASVSSNPASGQSHKVDAVSAGPGIILYNANVLTMDDSVPHAEAVAIEGNRILAVGLNDEILALQTPSTQLYDLEGKTVLPGLIDDHSHRLLHAFWDGGPEGLIRASKEAAADGYTTIHEMYGSHDLIWMAKELAESDQLAVRINAYVPYNTNAGDDTSDWMTFPYTQKVDTTIRVAGIKIFADGGSVGYPSISTIYQSGGAAGSHGDLFKPQAEMNAAVAEVLAAGYPITMHALGDSAVGVGLNAFEAAFAGGGNTLRNRITHVRIMREDLADQMAELGVVASIQYTWANGATAERFAERFEPEVLDWVYAWRRMADRGIPITVGDDFPWTSRSQAMQALSILATRQTQAGETVPDWMAGDQLTVEEGLRAMTVTNAWVAFEDDLKGSITPGKLADLTIVSDDPLVMDAFDVRTIDIEMTIMNGIIRHNQIGISHTAVHDAGTFAMGIDDRGLWGQVRTNVGLIYNGKDHLYHGSVLISYDSDVIATGMAQSDYGVSENGWVQFDEPGVHASEEATVIYEDVASGHPGHVRITQKTYMWENEPLLLVDYTFTNISGYPLADIFLGQAMDFDPGNWRTGAGGWDENGGLGFAYMYDGADPQSSYVGMAFFDDEGNHSVSSLSIQTGLDLRAPNEGPISDRMRSGVIDTVTPDLGDYAILMSLGPFDFAENESISPFHLAFVAGDNLEELKSAVRLAYTRASSLVDAVAEISEIPETVILAQNHPNPFSGSTIIGYTIPKASAVELSVYDIRGRHIETLVDEYRGPGTFEVRWYVKERASGIYFYRLRTGKRQETRRFIVIR